MIYFHIDYLKSDPVDIQQNIRDVITAMNTGGASLPHEISKAISHDAIHMASVGASGQHLRPLTNPKKIRVRERRLECEYLAMVNAQNDITRTVIQGRNGITI
jgi:Uri superfamily endonuclease